MALELDMVSLGHVSLDGSKFKANSSKHKAMSYGRMKERERQLCEEIEVLVERAGRCDEDARIMGKKGAFDYAYNAQIGVDGEAQIIVGQHVSQAANDQREVCRAPRYSVWSNRHSPVCARESKMSPNTVFSDGLLVA